MEPSTEMIFEMDWVDYNPYERPYNTIGHKRQGLREKDLGFGKVSSGL